MEHQARRAIKQFLLANESTFFDGIVTNTQRGWKHVTTSGLTPPTGYYFASVFVEEAPVQESTLGQNVPISIPTVRYSASIVVVDYINGVANEDELYETMDTHFQVVTDRVKLGIFDAGTFVYDSTYDDYDDQDAVTFSLPKDQRVVNKSNTLVRFPEAEDYEAVVATQLSFQLEECIAS